MRLFRRRPRPIKPPPRHWFAAEDGTFYRNCPLIMAERKEVRAWPTGTPDKWILHEALVDEWWAVFRAGVIRKPALGPGDVVVEAGSFREAYPRHSGLWALDDKAGAS